MSPDSKTYWERVALLPWGRYIAGIERETVIEAARMAEAPAVALDVGCDGGRCSGLLLELGWQVICTDINPQALRLCQERLPQAQCIRVSADEKRFPCKTESLGLLLCIEVPSVLQSDWFMHESLRVLTRGGLLVTVFWNLLSLRGALTAAITALKDNPAYRPLLYPAWKQKMQRNGFSIVYERGFSWFLIRRDIIFPPVSLCSRLEQRIGLPRFVGVSPEIMLIARKV